MGLRTGIFVKRALEHSEALMGCVEGRVYHVLAPMGEENRFPYVVFASDGFVSQDTKDGDFGDSVSVEIVVVARCMEELIDVAQNVREAMREGANWWNEDKENPFQVYIQSLHVGAEDFDMAHDGYFLPMVYTIEVESI